MTYSMQTDIDPFHNDDIEMGVTPARPGAANWVIASACTLACAALGAALVLGTM
jgi:hypothetical protein